MGFFCFCAATHNFRQCFQQKLRPRNTEQWATLKQGEAIFLVWGPKAFNVYPWRCRYPGTKGRTEKGCAWELINPLCKHHSSHQFLLSVASMSMKKSVSGGSWDSPVATRVLRNVLLEDVNLCYRLFKKTFVTLWRHLISGLTVCRHDL